MWLNLGYHHKMLDIEKMAKKLRIFHEKSVDKSLVGLVYYSSTSPEHPCAEML